MRVLNACLALGLACLGVSARVSAAAERCGAGVHSAEGPVVVGVLRGLHGKLAPLCLTDGVGARAGGLLLVDTDNFYGNIRADLNVDAQWRLSGRVGLFAELQALRYQTVISSVSAAALGIGHLALGGLVRLAGIGHLHLSAFSRLVLPTATGLYGHARPFALDFGIIGSLPLSSVWRVHGGVLATGSAAVSAGPALPRAGLGATAGIEAVVWQRLSVKLDIHSLFFYRALVDHLALVTELRFFLGAHGHLGVVVSVPVAGFDRSLMRASLGGGYQF